jgi:glyoxylase-like metal-dependent hydrolase (beta-lactamase superfamily II)
VLVAADHVLDPISPAVGLWPASRKDPLGDYLDSLRRTIELAPRIALPGHGQPILDPAGRARALIEHHRRRLGHTEAVLGPEPSSAYDVSLALFGSDLTPSARRFAVAETLSHLERLVREERALRHEHDGTVSYTAAQKP